MLGGQGVGTGLYEELGIWASEACHKAKKDSMASPGLGFVVAQIPKPKPGAVPGNSRERRCECSFISYMHEHSGGVHDTTVFP